MITLVATNTILQTIVTKELRGRVVAFYAMSILGTAPLGSLLAGGVVADRIGTTLTVQLGGAVCIAGGIAFAFKLPHLRVLVRPIYASQGILAVPEMDSGAKTL